MMKSWSAHYCLLDRECRECDAPPRLHFHSPWGSLVITIPPLYRCLDLNSVYPHEKDEIPTLTGKKIWAWEWPFLIKK